MTDPAPGPYVIGNKLPWNREVGGIGESAERWTLYDQSLKIPVATVPHRARSLEMDEATAQLFVAAPVFLGALRRVVLAYPDRDAMAEAAMVALEGAGFTYDRREKPSTIDESAHNASI